MYPRCTEPKRREGFGESHGGGHGLHPKRCTGWLVVSWFRFFCYGIVAAAAAVSFGGFGSRASHSCTIYLHYTSSRLIAWGVIRVHAPQEKRTFPHTWSVGSFGRRVEQMVSVSYTVQRAGCIPRMTHSKQPGALSTNSNRLYASRKGLTRARKCL